jgi:hypothetical protein
VITQIAVLIMEKLVFSGAFEEIWERKITSPLYESGTGKIKQIMACEYELDALCENLNPKT